MALRLASQVWKRQQDSGSNGGLGEDSGQSGQYEDYDDGGWWWSSTGMAIRYTIITVIFASLLLFLLGGYWHARRRMRNGLPPLAYHAWMVRRRQPRYQYNPYYYQPSPYHQQAPHEGYYAYPMQGNAPPPPYSAPPPAYAPPQGASKAMADQSFPSVQAHREHNPGESSQVAPPPPAR